MSRGQVLPPENRTCSDPRTGATVRQVTRHPSIHHHPFYYLPCMDDAMQRLIFVSHRTGRPEIWCEVRATGELQQLTDQEGINEWSVHPSHDGQYVYFTTGKGASRANTTTLEATCLFRFEGAARSTGMVGAAMGTTTVSHDDRYWAVPVKVDAVSRFVVFTSDCSGFAQVYEVELRDLEERSA